MSCSCCQSAMCPCCSCRVDRSLFCWSWYLKESHNGLYLLLCAGDCLYYKMTGFTESSSVSRFKFTVSGSTPGSFDIGYVVLCSIFNISSVFQYSHLLLLLHWFFTYFQILYCGPQKMWQWQ